LAAAQGSNKTKADEKLSDFKLPPPPPPAEEMSFGAAEGIITKLSQANVLPVFLPLLIIGISLVVATLSPKTIKKFSKCLAGFCGASMTIATTRPTYKDTVHLVRLGGLEGMDLEQYGGGHGPELQQMNEAEP